MRHVVQLRRGPKSEIKKAEFHPYEIGFTTDTNELVVFDGLCNPHFFKSGGSISLREIFVDGNHKLVIEKKKDKDEQIK